MLAVLANIGITKPNVIIQFETQVYKVQTVGNVMYVIYHLVSIFYLYSLFLVIMCAVDKQLVLACQTFPHSINNALYQCLIAAYGILCLYMSVACDERRYHADDA